MGHSHSLLRHWVERKWWKVQQVGYCSLLYYYYYYFIFLYYYYYTIITTCKVSF